MENSRTSTRQKPLTLTDMSSAFVLLGLGLSLAVLVFLIELIYKRINDQYFNDKVANEIKAPTTETRHPIRAPVTVQPAIRPLPAAPIAVQPVRPTAVPVKVPKTRPLAARKTAVKPVHPPASVVRNAVKSAKLTPVPLPQSVKLVQAATVVDKTSPLFVLDGKAPIILTPPIAVANAFADNKTEKQQIIKVPANPQPTIVPPPPPALPAGTVNEG